MSYFLVDGNSAGLHSQVRRGTEVAAMITSLLQHDTMMMVEANCVDSHGQSELGFAFCRFLFVELLPWLKRMKYERLYLPDRDIKGDFPHLSGVLARPIRWYQAHEHYSDMARHVVAAKERTAPVDSLYCGLSTETTQQIKHTRASWRWAKPSRRSTIVNF